MERRADIPRRRRSYCRRDGWLCRPGSRCDRHRPNRDPEHWASRFINGADFIFGPEPDGDE